MKPHESNTHTLNVIFVVTSRITNPYSHLLHLMRLNNLSSLQSKKPHEINTHTSVHESEANM